MVAGSDPAAPCSGTFIKPMSESWVGRLPWRLCLWTRGRVGCSMVDCCRSMEPLEEVLVPLGVPLVLELGPERKQELCCDTDDNGTLKHLQDLFGSDTRTVLANRRSLAAHVATLAIVSPRWSCKSNGPGRQEQFKGIRDKGLLHRIELTGVLGESRSNGDLQNLPTGLQYDLVTLSHLELNLPGAGRLEWTPATFLHLKLQSEEQKIVNVHKIICRIRFVGV